MYIQFELALGSKLWRFGLSTDVPMYWHCQTYARDVYSVCFSIDVGIYKCTNDEYDYEYISKDPK